MAVPSCGAPALLVTPYLLEKLRHAIGELEQLTDPRGRSGRGTLTGVCDLVEQIVDPAGEIKKLL